jgi:hypothetical protein
MAYASLSIDLKAQLANLQSGMDKAVRVAEKNAARIEKSFAAIKGIAGGIGGALAAGLGGAGVVSFIQQTNDALLAIKDLSEGTGSTVENISALENALRANNRTLAEAQPILVKFNGALKEADGKNGVSQALQAIGLSAEELRRLDPVLALQQVGQALQGYENDANKARIVQELFGKSVAEVIPFLNDLAESQLKATDGIRQATEEADKFEKNLARLSSNVTDLARELSGPLVAGLNKTFDAFKGKGLFEQFNATVANLKLKSVVADMENLQRAIDFKGSTPELEKRMQALRDDAKRLTAEVQRATGALKELSPPEAGRRPANEGGGGLATLRKLPEFLGSGNASKPARTAGGSSAGAREFVGPPVPEALTSALRLIEQTDVRKIEELQDQLQQLLNLRGINGDSPALAEAITDVSLAIDELNAKRITPGVDIKSDFLRSEKAGYEETEKFLKDLQDQSKKVESVADELGLTFQSAFEDAIVGGKSFREVLAGIEADILRIITRNLVTKPLADGISGLLKGALGGGGGGGGIGSFLSSLFGGFFADGGYLPPGRWGIAGERGPEPIFGGRTGVTVKPAGGMQVTQHFHIAGGADRATQAQVFAAAARGLAAAQRNN